jgi:hypothetical protein
LCPKEQPVAVSPHQPPDAQPPTIGAGETQVGSVPGGMRRRPGSALAGRTSLPGRSWGVPQRPPAPAPWASRVTQWPTASRPRPSLRL